MPRLIQLVGSALLLVLTTAAHAGPNDPLDKLLADRTIGDAKAPVAIVEYSSLTCSHCAEFHKDMLPRIRDGLVATGKATFTFRDFPLDSRAALAAMVARCLPADRYFGFLDVLFSTQEQWAKSADSKGELRRLAKLAGLGESEFNACLDNRGLFDGINARRQEAQQRIGIEGTPTLLVDGKVFTGKFDYDQIAAAVDRAAAAKRAKP